MPEPEFKHKQPSSRAPACNHKRLCWVNFQLSCMLSHFSRVKLFATLRTVACQAPVFMGFSRQEYWSGLPFPSLGNLLNPRSESGSACIVSRFFTLWVTREALYLLSKYLCLFFLDIQFKLPTLTKLSFWIPVVQRSASSCFIHAKTLRVIHSAPKLRGH